MEVLQTSALPLGYGTELADERYAPAGVGASSPRPTTIMTDLFAAVCSIAPTKRRRFAWAAWWTGAPEREPFRRPDAAGGGAKTAAEALAEAEKAAGRKLLEIDPRWAGAWARVLKGEPAWTERQKREAAGQDALPARKSAAPARSIWTTLGLTADATDDQIKRAYRERALETHPDRGGDPARFREVKAAYAAALKRRKQKRTKAGGGGSGRAR
jgi:DnaJ domain